MSTRSRATRFPELDGPPSRSTLAMERLPCRFRRRFLPQPPTTPLLCSGGTVGATVSGARQRRREGPMGAVEHLKTLCCLGLKPESAMIALTPLLHEIIPHGASRLCPVAPDATMTTGYADNPA